MKYDIDAQSTSPAELLRIVREKKKQENPLSINSEDEEEDCAGEEVRSGNCQEVIHNHHISVFLQHFSCLLTV